MTAGDKEERVFRAAQTEQNPELRAEAIGQLGNMSAHEELCSSIRRNRQST